MTTIANELLVVPLLETECTALVRNERVRYMVALLETGSSTLVLYQMANPEASLVLVRNTDSTIEGWQYQDGASQYEVLREMLDMYLRDVV